MMMNPLILIFNSPMHMIVTRAMHVEHGPTLMKPVDGPD